MNNKELNEKLNNISRWSSYAIGHLDDEYGYNDEVALSTLENAINELCNLDEINVYINLVEVNNWKEFIVEIKNSNDTKNSLTKAVAYAIKSIAESFIEID